MAIFLLFVGNRGTTVCLIGYFEKFLSLYLEIKVDLDNETEYTYHEGLLSSYYTYRRHKTDF